MLYLDNYRDKVNEIARKAAVKALKDAGHDAKLNGKGGIVVRKQHGRDAYDHDFNLTGSTSVVI